MSYLRSRLFLAMVATILISLAAPSTFAAVVKTDDSQITMTSDGLKFPSIARNQRRPPATGRVSATDVQYKDPNAGTTDKPDSTKPNRKCYMNYVCNPFTTKCDADNESGTGCQYLPKEGQPTVGICDDCVATVGGY